METTRTSSINSARTTSALRSITSRPSPPIPTTPTTLATTRSSSDPAQDDERAEGITSRPAADPIDANNLGNYAAFLETQRKNDARAEEYYLKALAADPNHANNLGNYANFLKNSERTMLGRRGITSRPSQPIPTTPTTSATTRTSSRNQRKDDARAEEYYLKAIAADPNHANNLGNYANFLKTSERTMLGRREYYLKALAADPKDADFLGNFANFLKNQRKDDARAEEYYLKAIAADPITPTTSATTRSFSRTSARTTRAEEYYLKAIAADPNHAKQLGNYAVFLETPRKDDECGRRSITSRLSPPIQSRQQPRQLRQLPQEPAKG